MLIDGIKANQQRYCDAALNAFADSPVRFRVMSDKVLVTSIYADEMRSLDPLERDRGSVSESDIAFWSLVRCMRLDHGGPDRLMWLPHFMFVDGGSAMASGREIFGYPKCTSQIVRKSTQPASADVTVETVHFPVFSPTTRASNQPITAIIGDGQPHQGEGQTGLDAVAARLRGAFESDVAAELGSLPIPQFGMPQVTLRQFPDATRAGRAALSEVLVITPQPGAVHAAGMLPGGLTVTVEQSASHDLKAMLGLQPRNPVLAGAWMTFAFVAGWADRLYP